MLRPSLLARFALLTLAPLAACCAALPAGMNHGPPPPPPGGAERVVRVGLVEVGPAQETPSPATSAAPDTPPAGNVMPKSPVTTTPAAPVVDAEDEAALASGERQKEPSGKKSVERADVASTGGLSEADVRAAIAERGAALRRCYEIGLTAAPSFSGTVALRVTVSPAGNVAVAEVVSSTTKNQTVDACVRDEIRKVVFKATGSGGVVAFPIELGQ